MNAHALTQLLGHRWDEQSKASYLERVEQAALDLGLSPTEAIARATLRDPVVYPTLVAALTIPETHFFRHPEHFQLLAREAEAAQADGRTFSTAWSVGCATGEEAYSLAIALRSRASVVRVAGSDVSSLALETARAGRYGPHSFRGCDPSSLPSLLATGSAWQVSESLRREVVFSELNLATDALIPPHPLPAQVDVVFCRNVFIYLQPEVIQRVMRQLFAAVAPGGLLLLGAMDGPVQPPDDFDLIEDDRATAFRRRDRRASARSEGRKQEVRGRDAARPERQPLARDSDSARRVDQDKFGASTSLGLNGGPLALSSSKRDSAHPSRPEWSPARPERGLASAQHSADRGELDIALRAAGARQDDPRALFLAAAIHLERNELARAEVEIRRLLLVRPSDPSAYFHLLLIALRRGDRAAASQNRARLEKLLEGRPDHEELESSGMKVAFIRQILGNLDPRAASG